MTPAENLPTHAVAPLTAALLLAAELCWAATVPA